MGILDLISITPSDIIKMDDTESTLFLSRLLEETFNRYELPISALTLCTNTNIPDEGIDAYIDDAMPEGINLIPSGTSIFQFKATSKFNAKNELCKKVKNKYIFELKDLINQYLNEGSTYVLINTRRQYTSSQKDKIKQEIRNVLIQCGFEKQVNLKIYSAEDIMRQSNKFPALRVEMGKLIGAITFEQWKTKSDSNIKRELIYSDSFKINQGKILNAINDPSDDLKNFRIVGMQGIGKKSFLIDTLDELGSGLKSNIVLFHFDHINLNDFKKMLLTYSINSGIIIIQDCTDKFHREICVFLNRSGKTDLILISYNDQKSTDNRFFPNEDSIKLSPLNEAESERLLNQIDSEIPFYVKKQILKLSNGIPLLIIIITDFLKNRQYKINSDFTLKYLCEDIITSITRESSFEQALLQRVLIGLSLFSYLGWKSSDYYFIPIHRDLGVNYENNLNIFCKILDIEQDKYKVQEIIRFLKRKEIIEKKGRYIHITLNLFAIYLLEEYIGIQEYLEFFQKVLEINNSHFNEKFFERLRDLSSSSKSTTILKLFLQSSYFNDWKIFNDSTKSRIFSLLTQINSELANKKLKELFENVESEVLHTELTCRRDLITSLEFIIWDENTFREGMDLLLKLSISENENYANNATNTFCDKFSVYIPGTSTSLEKRMIYLKSLAREKDNQKLPHLLNAISCIFYINKTHRDINAEIQGLKPLSEEYHPKSKKEIINYIKDAFILLENYFDSPSFEIREIAFEILNNNIEILYDLDLWDKIKSLWSIYIKFDENNKFKIIDTIEMIVRRQQVQIKKLKNQINEALQKPVLSNENPFIIDFVNEINETINSRKSKIQESENEDFIDTLVVEKINSIQINFTPMKLFKDNLKSSFSLKEKIQWALIHDDYLDLKNFSYEECMKKQAKEFALKIHSDSDNFKDIIKFLITEQRSLIYYIGLEYAKLDNYNNWSIIKEEFKNLIEKRNTEFILGYLSDIQLNNTEKYNRFINELRDSIGLIRELYYFAIRKKIDEWSIDLIIELYNSGKIDDSDLLEIAYPQKIEHLTNELLEKLIFFYYNNVKNPLDRGNRNVQDHLFILKTYFDENKKSITKMKDLMLKVVLSFEHFENYESNELNSGFSFRKTLNLSDFWKDIIILLVETYSEEINTIRKKILDNLTIFPSLDNSRSDVQDIMIWFFNIDDEGTWKEFIQKFKDDSGIDYFYQWYFNHEFFEIIPIEWILEQCNEDFDNFIPILTKSLRLKIKQSDVMPSLMRALIEKFPDNEKLLIEFKQSFESGIWVFIAGESYKIFESKIKLLKKWKESENLPSAIKWIESELKDLNFKMEQAKKIDEEVDLNSL